MARHTAIHIGKVFSRLGEFWSADKYTDVTIICAEDKHFKCHRLVLAAACKYFDAMFVGGRFRDSISENISLPEMSAEAFEQVLQFIYTGDAQIDSKNVLSVLEASEFLELPGMEDLCVQSLKADGLNVQDTLCIFMFACATGKEYLVDLLSLHIVNHFEIFSKVDSFLDIPFNDLRRILSRFTRSSMRNEEALLSLITRWIHHKREERLQFLQEFVQMIRFENISSTYIQYMFTKLMLNAHHTAVTQTIQPVGYSEDLVFQVSAASQTSETLLHIFVKHINEENLLNIYSINSAQVCSISEYPILLKHPSQWLHNIAFDKFHLLYRLQRTTPNLRLSTGDNFFEQSFYAYTSVNTSLGLRLKDPPVNFHSNHVGACALKNNIYAYYSHEHSVANLENSSNFLSKEEINRGICAYNCEVDDWFPVPEMKERTKGASLTSLNNILYLIGGFVDSGRPDTGHVQMYDCREGIWQELAGTHYRYVGGTSCSLNGKVYIYSGMGIMTRLERFDPAAGRWEEMATRPLRESTFCKLMVPYLDQLYVMGGVTIIRSCGSRRLRRSIDLSIDIFDVKSCAWKESSVLTETSITGSGEIMDAFIFKS